MMHEISKGERILVSWLIGKLEGVNRTDARLIRKVSEHLELDDVMSVPMDEIEEASEFELAELETEWILDYIDKSFGKQEVPPALSKYALSMEEKFKQEQSK